MKQTWICGLIVAVLAMPALGESNVATGAKAGPIRIFFPVVVDPPLRMGGHAIKSSEPFYEQTLRSPKAVRLTQPYVFEYKPWALDRRNLNGKPSSITIPAGTILVQARSKDAEFYCTAATEGEDGWGAFYDLGYCARDLDGDGVLDQELIVEQTFLRVLVAYEIVGPSVDSDTWRPAKLAYQLVPEAEIPPVKIQMAYTYSKPVGGLFSFASGAVVYVSCSMLWPGALTLPTAAKVGGGAAGFEVGSFSCKQLEKFNHRNPNPGPKLSFASGAAPLDFTLTGNADMTVDVEFRSAIPAGPGVLVESYGEWRRDDPKFQAIYMRLVTP